MRTLTRSVAGLTFVAVAALGATACDSDGDGQPDIGITLPDGADENPDGGDGGDGGEGGGATTDPPTPEPTEVPAPEPTDAPTPEPTDPPAPQPTEAPGGGGADTGQEGDDDWVPLLLALLGVAAVGLVLALVVGSRQKVAASSGVDRRRELVATAGWVHDQLTLEVLAMPPAEGLRRWTAERSRVDQLGIDGRMMGSSGYREMWEQLGMILVQLSGSIDTALRMGTMQGTDPALVAEAMQNAHRHRAELGAWVATARSLL